MKNYTGTKTVSAEPMNEFDAVQKGIARPNTDNHEFRDGYHVVYPDGYESWSPKDVFEEAYKCSETHIDRMKIEYEELKERINRLKDFLNSNANSIDEDEESLLKAQRLAMCSYCSILSERLLKCLISNTDKPNQ